VSPLGPHSYDPGYSPASVFWTIEIPEDSVEVDLNAATAALRLDNVCQVFDAFTVPNSNDPSHPLGLVSGLIRSLRIQWSGFSKLWTFNNGTTFRGSFIQNVEAPIEVTVTTPATKPPFTPSAQDGFAFTSDPKTTTTNWVQIGQEANGALY
jgi:hypothetical protein